MDEPTLPTPDELGVSADEYARIVRDLELRGLGGEAVAFAAELTRTSVPDDPRALHDAPAAVPGRPAKARDRRWPLVLAVLLVLAPLGWRAVSRHAHQAPAYAFL